jgi:hypothetical protein
VTTNLWTIGQQLIIRKMMKPYQAPTADKPAKRSRIVDALVSASEQKEGDKAQAAKPGTGAKKQRSNTEKPRSGGKPRPKKKSPAGGKPAGAEARKESQPGARADSTSSAKPGGSRPGGSRPGGKRRPSSQRRRGGRPGSGGKPGSGSGSNATP